jgi:hypothetical protein
MDYSDEDATALIEALTLERVLVEAHTPLFQGFGGDPRHWNYWGGPYGVHPNWNKNGIRDIEYKNSEGVRHRLSGPAYISRLYDIEAWYKEGVMHRVGGPAYRHKRNFVWFKEGKLHRLDGPAVNELAGPKQYWIDGVRFSEKQYKWEISRRKKKGLL